MQCRYCEGTIGTSAQKCKHCGEWVSSSPTQAGRPLHSSVPQDNSSASVVYERHESAAFAIVVFLMIVLGNGLGLLTSVILPLSVFFLCVALVGKVLIFVGLLTGPRRGCFFTMFLLFFVVPLALLAAVIYGGLEGFGFIGELIEELGQPSEHNPAPFSYRLEEWLGN